MLGASTQKDMDSRYPLQIKW